jgi:hypothetical protein
MIGIRFLKADESKITNRVDKSNKPKLVKISSFWLLEINNKGESDCQTTLFMWRSKIVAK